MKPDPFIAKALDPRSFTRQAQDEFDAWLRTQGMTWRGVESGAYGISLNDALVMWTISDPVRWAETFLIEQRTGKPYQLFDYQRESIRAWRQDVVHQDGAEVGKTREIITLLLWGACTGMGGTVSSPWFLVGAPQQSFLDEIAMAIEEQVGVTADGDARGTLISTAWMKPKRTPHTLFRMRSINLNDPSKPGVARIYFRPAGHDGEAFRGVHVNGMGFLDEAAKLKNPKHWSEFYRALEPGAKVRVYSVPDGDNASEYYKLTMRAVPGLREGENGVRLFRWPKTLMPPPFFTPERDAEFIRRFGGRHSPGYLRNVLGEHGQAENPVWSWDLVLPNVVDLPNYRVIKLRADPKRDELGIEVLRVTLSYAEGKKLPTEHVVEQRALDLSAFTAGDDAARRAAWQRFFRERLLPDDIGVWFAGADLGESNDPTEILISEQRGAKLIDTLRVSAIGLPYHAQQELIFCLSELLGFNVRWGVDLGAAGTAVVKNLHTVDAYAAANFEETLTGFQFAGSVDCIGEDGEPLEQPDANGEMKVLRVPAKHWATQCITSRLQAVNYAMAYDNDVLRDMTNHTAREGAKWPIYSKQADHTIDARRMQMLRKLYDDTAGTANHFSTGVHDRRAA